MTEDQAQHISLMAAPLYAAVLSGYQAANTAKSTDISAEILEMLREHAITQALALYLQTLDTIAPEKLPL